MSELAEKQAAAALKAAIDWLGNRGMRVCRFDADKGRWFQVTPDDIDRLIRKDRDRDHDNSRSRKT